MFYQNLDTNTEDFYFSIKRAKVIIGLIYDDPHPGKFMAEFGKTD